MKQILVLLLIGVAVGNAIDNPLILLKDVLRNNGNPTQEILDNTFIEMINIVKYLIHNNLLIVDLSPLVLPDIIEKLQFKSIHPPRNAKLILLEGTENDLDTLYPYSNVKLNSNEDLFNVTLYLGHPTKTFKYDYILESRNQLGEGKLTLDIEEFAFSFEILIDRRTFKIELGNLAVVNVGAIKINIESNDFSDWLLKQKTAEISQIIINQGHSFAMSQVQHIIEELVIEANNAP